MGLGKKDVGDVDCWGLFAATNHELAADARNAVTERSSCIAIDNHRVAVERVALLTSTFEM